MPLCDLSTHNLSVHLVDRGAAASDASLTRLNFEPGKMEKGVLQLVLSLVELIRQLLEKQAMRRVDAGSLGPADVDRLGRSLMELDRTVQGLQAQFGITNLNIDLGPIGTLLDER